jgi:methylenetetrahydrofolate reductase (NADPH)
MNLETSCIKIIDQNGTMNKQRDLPFTKPTMDGRSQEEVRPIFWANNTKSYISRTQTWDNFPNGRWGQSFSPAFKAEEEGFVSFAQKPKKQECDEKRKLWGENIDSLVDVRNVFVKYVTR